MNKLLLIICMLLTGCTLQAQEKTSPPQITIERVRAEGIYGQTTTWYLYIDHVHNVICYNPEWSRGGAFSCTHVNR